MRSNSLLGLSATGGLTKGLSSRNALLPILLVAGGMMSAGNATAADLTINPTETQIFAPGATWTSSPTTTVTSFDYVNVNGGTTSTRGGTLIIGGSDAATITAGTALTVANSSGNILLTTLTLQGGVGAAGSVAGAGGAGGAVTLNVASTIGGNINVTTGVGDVGGLGAT
ncbi:MAG: hypothetical protein HQL89_14860, partial [Magnetococcales bacterium]|nr:hypothetical protein [Magnetococcales bacterium]